MLQIVADDLGLDPAVNEGIFFAFKNGLIDKTSLMANGSAFDHAVAGLTQAAGLKLGIHLVEHLIHILPHYAQNHQLDTA